MATLDSLVVELKADIKGLQASLRTATGEVQKFSGTSEKSIASFHGILSRAQGAVVAFGGAWAAFRVGKDIVDAGVQIKSLEGRMAAATGDAQVAAQAMAYVRSEANRLGQNLVSVGEGFSSFAASAVRSGLSFEDTKRVFSGVSEAATALGLSNERTGLVFAALAQMAGKGKVSLEELQGQLGESLPGALQIFAGAVGKTVPEFLEMVSAGEVLTPDLVKLGNTMHEQFGVRAVEAAQGAQGAFNRLQNAWLELKADMGNAGFIDAVTTATTNMTAVLQDPATKAGLIEFARLIGEIAKAAVQAAAAVGRFFGAASDRKRAIEELNTQGLAATPAQIEARTRGYSAVRSMQDGTGRTPSDKDGTGGLLRLPRSADQQQFLKSVGGPVSFMPEMLPGNDMTASLDTGTMSDASLSGTARPLQGAQGGGTEDPFEQVLATRLALVQAYSDATVAVEQGKNDQLSALNEGYWAEAQDGLAGFLGIQLRTQEQINADSVADQSQTFRTTLQQAANHNKTFFMLEKAAAIARALIAARESVVSAYNFGSRLGGPALGATFAAVAAAAQAANIAAIASTSYGGAGGGGGGGGVSSGGSSTGENQPADNLGRPVRPTTQVIISIEGGDRAVFTKDQLRGLIDQLNDAVKDGSRLEVYAA